MLTSKRWPSHPEPHREVAVGGGGGDIDAAPACKAHSVIVINNSEACYLSADRPVCLPTIRA